MPALKPCWFSRIHRPSGRSCSHGQDGAHVSTCRHCGKRIISWTRKQWQLADGFNITRLIETTGTRFLYLVDHLDDMVLARFPVTHLESEDDIKAYALELKEAHHVDDAGSCLMLLDSHRS